MKKGFKIVLAHTGGGGQAQGRGGGQAQGRGGQAQGTSRSPAPTHPHAPQTHACMYEHMRKVLNKTETGRHA